MRLFAVTLCALVAAPVAALGQDLPPGPGADLVQKACQNCHGLDTVTSARNNLDGWRSVVSTMVDNGASLSDQEADQVSNYLATNFGFGPPPAAGAAPAAPANGAATPATPASPAAPAGAAPADQMPATQ